MSKTTEPLRTLLTFNKILGSFKRDCIAFSNDEESEVVQEDNDQPSRRNTNDASSGAGAGPGAGEGEDPGGDGLELQSVLCQNHLDEDATHCPSFDEEDEPDLHIARAGHHPQELAEVQSRQVDKELQVSAAGGGGGAGAAPLAKAVQSNTDRTGSRVHGELVSPQLFLMVFSRVLAVTYAKTGVAYELITVLHPNINEAVPSGVVGTEMLMARLLTRAYVDNDVENS